MMTAYEVKLADGQEVQMAGRDFIHAMERAADLYGVDAVAWRQPSNYVTAVHHSQIIG